jgi:hypothetical protein
VQAAAHRRDGAEDHEMPLEKLQRRGRAVTFAAGATAEPASAVGQVVGVRRGHRGRF